MRQATPLCPAGHLPLKGGDRMSRRLSPISIDAELAVTRKLPISPLEGEMAGRPEGGALALPSRDFRSAGIA
ncbi:lytic murein transglycosylase [Mesorhizobium sp. M1C.F.Ca.ET.193.01.1.1]|nr:MAG: lytic murein transglycosylase [Mesorhizobium sp.]TGQ49988.1 lytic murein transglycosylase [Mesorhizobium sp. M1C.F.Ca.ET.210.01.1.1]TGQ64446.1 lytic murein transglycosylase [Mesorhizobium sp. M1C.F.Ca.ET.212.01.1.1]TGQ98306.1 lytic murein transglycosylase [Mesorhizobium sp. M1C.F.Ca.ET.204.01.1.1]TGR18522.1 lytic murein transglycosylase [Mesorhizobium sp. M1C.F.Ca.ET.196.01.1.1]TGR40855.1 lytic murein transglycosylase [Mesorhizobium sp. M1C.F.Ca.ET.195.01.1.1]TGR60901.1 lytic murein t